MKVLSSPLADWEMVDTPTAVTVGVFDGVHLGHCHLLDRLHQSGHPVAVLTFDPHPAEVLSPGTHPRLITDIDERIALLEAAGVDLVGILDLAEIRVFSPDEFVSKVLVDRMDLRLLAVGSDFHFGRDRTGDAGFLVAAGARFGFEVEIVNLVESEGVISSSRIRRLIEEGEVGAAARLLGTRFRLSNQVLRGDGRGKDLGFPTANLIPPPRKVIPGRGVYAAYARLGGEVHPAAVNVGVRPTFGEGRLLVEAYLLDFDRNIYGEVLTLDFVERLRPELKFDRVDELVEAMRDDVARVRKTLDAAVTG